MENETTHTSEVEEEVENEYRVTIRESTKDAIIGQLPSWGFNTGEKAERVSPPHSSIVSSCPNGKGPQENLRKKKEDSSSKGKLLLKHQASL